MPHTPPRRWSTAALTLVLVVGLLATFTGTAAAAVYTTAETDFIAKMNVERRDQGLGALRPNAQLRDVARAWTGRMAAENKLYHNPNLASQITGSWTRAGENVGYTRKTGAGEPELVQRLHDAFMASPGHRANVLGAYNQTGVGVTIGADGKMWVTVVFMQAPLPANAPPPPPAPVPVVAPPPPPPPDVSGQITEGVSVSREVFADAGAAGGHASHVVLARADVFADALAGSALAGDLGPILLTEGPVPGDRDPALHRATRAEIDRVLGGTGVVYILGGHHAVSDRAARELDGAGYTIRRLAGADRIATAARAAREAVRVRGDTGQVLITRADDWADAVSGGAYASKTGTPILLTGQSSLAADSAAFLADHRPARRFVLGGPVALSYQVLAAAGAERIGGADRYATAVEIARVLWGRTSANAGDAYLSAPGNSEHGWAYALVQAPLAADADAPQLLVNGEVPGSVHTYLTGLRYADPVTGDVTPASPVPDAVVSNLRRLLGAAQ